VRSIGMVKPCRPSTLSLCESSDAILFGSVGGPEQEALAPELQPERASLLALGKHFNLFCNIRPAKLFRSMVSRSPLHPEIVKDGVDILCVRELSVDPFHYNYNIKLIY